nr:hypothetical protein [Faecalibaculum rodentium]
MDKKKTLYIHYDKRGNIDALADTVKELARMTGRTSGSIYSMISKGYRRWAKVEVEDE